MNVLCSVSDDLLRDRLVALVSNGKFSKADLALGQVDDTSDLNKPISSLTQNALNSKIPLNFVGAVNGVAGLDLSAKLFLSNLPNFSSSILTDFLISSPLANQVLTYNGVKWVNADAGSGGGSLSQTPITLGLGDGTTNPQSVVMRGPRGVGTNVIPGDLTIQPPIGTGDLGSGSIKMQSYPSVSTSVIMYTQSSKSASTSFTYELYFPEAGSFTNVSAIFTIQNFPAATPSLSIPGVTFTTLQTSLSNSTVGGSITIIYAQNTTATGTKTLTISNSVSSMTYFQICFLENAATPLLVTPVTFSSASSSSVTVTNVTNTDLIFDTVIYGKNTSTTALHEAPANFISLPFYMSTSNAGGSSPYSYLSTCYRYGGTGTITMSRTYTTNVSGTHVAFIIKSQRVSSSTQSNLLDSLTVNNGTVRVGPTPTGYTETSTFDTFMMRALKPSSPRLQQVRSTLTTPTANYFRALLLPRADYLPLGTVFYIKPVTSGTNFFWCSIAPYGSQLTSNSTSNSLRFNATTVVNTAAGTLSAEMTLIDNSTPSGLWIFREGNGDSVCSESVYF